MQAICCKAIRKSPVNQTISNNALLIDLAATVQEKKKFNSVSGTKLKKKGKFAKENDIFGGLQYWHDDKIFSSV